jgi:hypothetical protein
VRAAGKRAHAAMARARPRVTATTIAKANSQRPALLLLSAALSMALVALAGLALLRTMTRIARLSHGEPAT